MSIHGLYYENNEEVINLQVDHCRLYTFIFDGPIYDMEDGHDQKKSDIGKSQYASSISEGEQFLFLNSSMDVERIREL